MPLRAIYKPEPPLKRWARRILPYAVAAFTTGAALGLSLLIPAIGEKPFFLLFFAATTACAWFYGISSGLASIGLSALAITYLILPRTGPLRIAEMDDAIRLLVFVAASIAVAWTVARLRRTQQALELAQERFELAHQIANIWSWELDLATGRVIWSSSAKNREEQREDPVQVWLQLVHADDRDRVLATLKEAVDTAKRYEIEFRIVVSDGSHRWIASSGEFYKTLKGEGRMIGINVDITRRKLAERALEAAAREEMAGELAHKINNPLQGLLHALYLLHQQSREVEVQRYAVAAQSEAERVARLVKELLRLYSEPPRAA